ncbi:MAG TPA: 3-methyl-2-oxobutanoate dehydrogenase subunit VorB [Anaerolineales bacterium]|nr:3-methyl-2-oxobutanoate dehydrogenase subunit VorB [Anaerolineales bacterium]
MSIELIKGNTAIAEAALRAGLDAYFGYPITPQTELLEHLAKRMPELGRVFLQAESEIGAIHMVYGAACAGARTMTSSSSPGVSLMAEGLSYIAASDVPMVLVDVMRGGPGLGNIAPAQQDYFQMVKGAGHGGYRPIVLAPATVQEAIDLTYAAFDLAEHYRTIVVILTDGTLAQMMEPAELPPMRERGSPVSKAWALSGAQGRERRIFTSVHMSPEEGEAYVAKMGEKWDVITANERRCVAEQTTDAEWLLVGFGTAGRVAQSAMRAARAAGLKVGMWRPISLAPYPTPELKALAPQLRGCLVVEMNAGQMIEDVRLAFDGKVPVSFFGRTGGVVPVPEEVLEAVERMVNSTREAVC